MLNNYYCPCRNDVMGFGPVPQDIIMVEGKGQIRDWPKKPLTCRSTVDMSLTFQTKKITTTGKLKIDTCRFGKK